MEIFKRILMKPLLVLLLLVQCAFLVFILSSVPKENARLRTALASLRTPSQSNIAPINQNDARELRLLLEEQVNGQKSFTTVGVLFSLVSIALMVALILPFGFKRAAETAGFDGELKL